MVYQIIPLSEQLYFIRWRTTPPAGSEIEQQFIAALQDLLDAASEPIYFMSDLRRGRISNVRALHQLSKLADHPNWGGGTSFSNNPVTMVLAGVFAEFVKHGDHPELTSDNPEAAIAFLESLKEGLTVNIDWVDILKG